MEQPITRVRSSGPGDPQGAAISLYGLNSGAALATVVGVLIEVP
jgi:hypothetical protein